jgi:8-oxo-dGTP diphosphatase
MTTKNRYFFILEYFYKVKNLYHNNTAKKREFYGVYRDFVIPNRNTILGPMDSEINRVYGGRLRVRVCGLYWREDQLLLVNHRMNGGTFWALPGGGLEYGQTMAETLVREFREEVHLDVVPGSFAFGCEFINNPLHAVELFFAVQPVGQGVPQTGTDPELPGVIAEVGFFSLDHILALPASSRHGIFRFCRKPSDFQHLHGFYRI